MKLFKARYTVCKECGVHFEPVTGVEARWGDLCKNHRKAVMEKDLRRDAILEYAARNLEKIGEMMDAERAAYSESISKNIKEMMNARAQAAAAFNLQTGPLGSSLANVFGNSHPFDNQHNIG